MKEFRVTVRFRMSWAHFDSTLTDYVMTILKREMAQHIDKLEIERIESKDEGEKIERMESKDESEKNAVS